MAQIGNPGSTGFQQLIDSYNEEIMRYSRLASPENDAAEEPIKRNAEREPEERREEGEFEAERGETERSYWLGKGKYGVIRRDAEEFRSAGAASDCGGIKDESEEPVEKDDPQKQWIEELEQGLLELKRGLAELAKGQRELIEGQLAFLNGIAEREYRLEQSCGRSSDGGFIPAAGTTNGDDFPSPAGVIPADPPDTPPAQSPDSVPADGAGFGQLQISVYTARRSVPVPDALVTVFSRGAPYASYTTDGDGKTPVIQLPAGISSSPDDSYASPFTNYLVIVTAEGYYPQNDLTAQIFSGETAFLPVEMVPLPDSTRF